jgi:hypothetical protein
MIHTIPVEDSENPDLAEVLQLDPEWVSIPVRLDGPQPVHALPAINASAFVTALTTVPSTITGGDLKLARAVLLGDAAWLYGTTAQNCFMPWPINVPLVLKHCQGIYARSVTGTVNLSAVLEYWSS